MRRRRRPATQHLAKLGHGLIATPNLSSEFYIEQFIDQFIDLDKFLFSQMIREMQVRGGSSEERLRLPLFPQYLETDRSAFLAIAELS
jgi:hypothetical protein